MREYGKQRFGDENIVEDQYLLGMDSILAFEDILMSGVDRDEQEKNRLAFIIKLNGGLKSHHNPLGKLEAAMGTGCLKSGVNWPKKFFSTE